MKLAQYDWDTLRTATADGARFKYVFFWGHSGRGDVVRQECLSQWYESPFTVDGLTFPTAEHYMMFRKAMLFGDRDTAEQVLRAPTPGAAKALGRVVHGFDEELWQHHRMEIVTTGNLAKFSQAPQLRRFLISTQERVLVEASPVDRIWGIGLAADHEDAENPARWRGMNLLGFAMMDVRDKL